VSFGEDQGGAWPDGSFGSMLSIVSQNVTPRHCLYGQPSCSYRYFVPCRCNKPGPSRVIRAVEQQSAAVEVVEAAGAVNE
jgi:hypothetical protein